MARNPKHKKLVDALIDCELEAVEMSKQAYEEGKPAAALATAIARKLVALRVAGKIGPDLAKQMLREGMRTAVLLTYSKRVHGVQEMVDRHAPIQMEAIRNLGAPLNEVEAIRNSDISERETEKKNG